jgi:hypothetical protein
MAPLLLLSVIPAFIGFWLGWRGSRRWPVLLVQAAGVTIGFLVLFLLAFADHPQQLNGSYILSAAQYWIFPYLVFLLIPCIIAQGIGKTVRRRAESTNELHG